VDCLVALQAPRKDGAISERRGNEWLAAGLLRRSMGVAGTRGKKVLQTACWNRIGGTYGSHQHLVLEMNLALVHILPVVNSILVIEGDS
jgi:hypothetical protein